MKSRVFRVGLNWKDKVNIWKVTTLKRYRRYSLNFLETPLSCRSGSSNLNSIQRLSHTENEFNKLIKYFLVVWLQKQVHNNVLFNKHNKLQSCDSDDCLDLLKYVFANRIITKKYRRIPKCEVIDFVSVVCSHSATSPSSHPFLSIEFETCSVAEF